jgi:hypothetical protein
MFVTMITPGYVPKWGTFECLREFLQNAKDEEDQHHHKMEVKYHKGWLRISNHGASIDRKALLLGESSKAKRADLRGQYGEGLDLAMLAGVRAGYEIRVYTCTEVWTPKIERVERFDSELLVIRTRTRKTSGNGVEARVKLPLEDWLEARQLFRFLVSGEEEDQIEVTGGTILFHPDRKGQIFAKGIYVTTLPSLAYGYDLLDVKLDRDRQMVDIWDLRWDLAAMLKEGVAKHPKKLSAPVYGMLRDKTEESHGMEYAAAGEFVDTMAAQFTQEHGKDAVPVDSMGESQQLDHLGAQGVVVSDTLKKVLERKLKTARQVRQELEHCTEQEHSWQDLEPPEQAVLAHAAKLIHEVTADLRSSTGLDPLMDRLHVVTFKKDDILGTHDRKTGNIEIARRALTDPHTTLSTLVHEEAHAISAAGDGAKSCVAMVERIWADLFFTQEWSW